MSLNGKKHGNTAVRLACLGYLILLFKITVFRPGFSVQQLFQNGTVNLELFTDYWNLLANRQYFRWTYLFVGNLIWFVPFGFFVPFLDVPRASFRKTALVGFLLSLLIETAQFVFGTGISELDDLILNTAGVLLGYALFRVYAGRKKHLSGKS